MISSSKYLRKFFKDHKRIDDVDCKKKTAFRVSLHKSSIRNVNIIVQYAACARSAFGISNNDLFQ